MAKHRVQIFFLLLFYLETVLVYSDKKNDEISSVNDTILSVQDFSSSGGDTKETTRKVYKNTSLYCSSPESSKINLFSRKNSNCRSAWLYCDNGTCKCGEIPNKILHCNTFRNLTIQTSNCLTYNEMEDLAEAGLCLYIVPHSLSDYPYLTIPKNVTELNDLMCGDFNRNGTLCGKCQDGHYPLVYSFDMNCIKCSNSKSNWWKFILVAFLPVTVFYFVVLFFKINVNSSHLHGFVFYSQTISTPFLMRSILLNAYQPSLKLAARYIGALYGIWNLDFLRSMNLGICLGTDTLQSLALDLAVSIYPFLLMVTSYLLIDLYDRNFRPLVIIWNPFYAVFGLFRRNWEIKTSLIDAFATFFLLSNLKFLSVSLDILAPVQVYQLNATGHLTYSWRVFFDATTPYFGEKHIPYAILTIAVLLLFVVLPMLLLIVYPFHWFQKFLNLFPNHWQILHTFMDSIQGCYKNGTQPGTRDCRWFASFFFLARFFTTLIGAISISSAFFPIASMILVLLILLLIIIQPFKSNLSHHSDVNAMFILLLALFYASAIGLKLSAGTKMFITLICGVVLVLPLLYVSTITLQWIYSQRKFSLELIRRLHALRHGYEQL